MFQWCVKKIKNKNKFFVRSRISKRTEFHEIDTSRPYIYILLSDIRNLATRLLHERRQQPVWRLASEIYN